MSCYACAEVIDCREFGGIQPDLAPSVGFFALQPYSVEVECPPGYYCFPGEFPVIMTFEPTDIPSVTIIPGGDSRMCLMGCLSMICRTVPADSTTDEEQAIANEVFTDWVAQQAFCNSTRNRQKKPLTLPPACFGTMYSYKIANGVGGMTAAAIVEGGFLPAGMFLSDPSAGGIYLTGAPTSAGTFGFTIKVSSPLQTLIKNYLLNVTLLTATPPGTTSNVLANATVGTPYTATFNPVSYAVPPVSWQVVTGVLPPGLSLDEATGVLSGTPTGMPGSYLFTILLQDHAS